METAEEILNPKERLGSELRDLRTRKGLSGAQLAEAVGGDQPKVSRIERGKRVPSYDDVRKWLDRVNADDATRNRINGLLEDARSWQGSFKERASGEDVQRDHTELVSESFLIRHVDPVWIPGPLQIPDYMRRVFREMAVLHSLQDDVEATVSERIKRQQYLYLPAKRWEFVIGESALNYALPGPEVMRAQLDRLQVLMALENVRLGVIPERVAIAVTPQNGLQIYVGDEPEAIVENAHGEYRCTPAETAFYQRWMDLLWEEALEGEEARERIARAARELGQ